MSSSGKMIWMLHSCLIPLESLESPRIILDSSRMGSICLYDSYSESKSIEKFNSDGLFFSPDK